MLLRMFDAARLLRTSAAAVAGSLLLAAAASPVRGEFYCTEINHADGAMRVCWIAEEAAPTCIVMRADAPDGPYRPASDVTTSNEAPVAGLSPLAFLRVQSVHPVNVPDPQLEQAFRDAITNKVEPADTLFDVEIECIDSIDLINQGILALNGIEYLRLDSINISLNKSITDLGPLQSLTHLTRLDAIDCDIESVEPLAALTNLTSLTIPFNRVSNAGPLASLTRLTRLSMSDNQVVDPGFLVGMTQLVSWTAANNQIHDLSSLSNLTSLQEVRVPGNAVADISPLAGLTNLTKVYLADNLVENISALVNNPGITAGVIIDLRGNPLSTFAREVDIPALQARGVEVLHD